MDDGTRAPAMLDSLSTVRLSTGILLLYVLTLLLVVPSAHKPSSPDPITVVVVADVHPRRAFIHTLLYFCAFTYLLDGLIVAIYWITRGFRQSYFVQWRGVEFADVLGVIAFAAIIVIGTWKERKGTDFWTRKRIKLFAFLAIAFDIAYLVLLVLAVRIFQKRPSSPGVPERPNVPGIYVPNFLHFLALDARLVALVIFLIVLFKPRTTYSTVRRDRPASPTPNTLLLPASTGVSLPQPTAYGTFNEQPPAEIAKDHAESTANDTYAPPKDTGKYKADGFDVDNTDNGDLAPLTAEGSSKHAGSSSHEQRGDEQDQDAASGAGAAIGAHTALLERDPEVEDVPNPVTDDPDALKTSYAAVAAAAADKDQEGEEAKKDGDDAPVAPVTSDSPTALAFPSTTRDDSSSIRGSTRGGVTFSDAPGDKNGNGAGDSTIEVGADGKKRKRLSSQNIKRIVRKIGDLPKRQGSISSFGSRRVGGDGTPGSVGGEGIAIPGETTPKKSREDSRASGEMGYMPSGESPAPSIDDSTKKWRKRMSLSIRRSTSTSGNHAKDDAPPPPPIPVLAPAKSDDPAPAQYDEPAPIKDDDPAPAKYDDPTPAKDDDPTPVKDHTPAPAPVSAPAGESTS